LEGYGLTETSPVVAVSNLITRELKVGTNGPVLPGVQVMFAEDGEILTKGPNLMIGYYQQPELTAEVIDKDGWFHTGDIGILDEGKYLKITDRKKEIFKLTGGKYIAPQMIENKLKESMFIEQVIVIGDHEKFASALIAPNFEYLHDWCAENQILYNDNNVAINHPKVQAVFQREVKEINKTLGQHEEIKRFRLITDLWSPQTGELSQTLKLKRRIIEAKYKDLIEHKNGAAQASYSLNAGEQKSSEREPIVIKNLLSFKLAAAFQKAVHAVDAQAPAQPPVVATIPAVPAA